MLMGYDEDTQARAARRKKRKRRQRTNGGSDFSFSDSGHRQELAIILFLVTAK